LTSAPGKPFQALIERPESSTTTDAELRVGVARLRFDDSRRIERLPLGKVEVHPLERNPSRSASRAFSARPVTKTGGSSAGL
jgi:hypothetical protein